MRPDPTCDQYSLSIYLLPSLSVVYLFVANFYLRDCYDFGCSLH